MGRWVTSGATSINKGVENAQLEPWPPRDHRATGSRINVNSFAVTDGRCACIALVYTRDAAFIARLAVYCFFYEDCSPESWTTREPPPELLPPALFPRGQFRPLLREYIDIFLSQFRESNSANWYDKRRRTLLCRDKLCYLWKLAFRIDLVSMG